jgi:hypothetical protein
MFISKRKGTRRGRRGFTLRQGEIFRSLEILRVWTVRRHLSFTIGPSLA